MKCYLKLAISSIDYMTGRFIVCPVGKNCLIEEEITPDMDIKKRIKELASKAVNFSAAWFDPNVYKAEIKGDSLYLYYYCFVPYMPETIKEGYELVSLKEFDITTQSDIESRSSYEF